jgi:hypothetical protein
MLTDIFKIKYTPIGSCDVEKVFSIYKNILANNRWKLLFQNPMHHVLGLDSVVCIVTRYWLEGPEITSR